MSRTGFTSTWLLVVLGSVPALAADLTNIDRTIVNEPAYTARPQYCLVVFGPQAATRVWLVRDGETLHVSDARGDLSGCRHVVRPPKASGFVVGNITEADDKTTHTNFTVYHGTGGY